MITYKPLFSEIFPLWVQRKHDSNEDLARLAWASVDALCSLPTIRGACWQHVSGQKRTSFAEIADRYNCGEDLVRNICSEVVHQFLVMGFRPVRSK